MANFTATPQSLRDAAGKLETEASNFETASKAAKTAADALAANWEGDSQKVFVTEQQNASNWYDQMTSIVRQYAVFLKNAASQYEAADSQAASHINQK